MPSFNTVGFDSLKKITNINTDNFLLVEDETGTNKLNYSFFKLQKLNTSFYTTIETISGTMTPLSADIETFKNSISGMSNITLNTQVADISSTIDNKFDRVFYKTGQLTIPAGSVSSNTATITVSSGVTLSVYDVRLTFNNSTFAAISGRIVNVYPSFTGSTPTYTLQAIITGPSTRITTVNYSIFKPY